MPEPYADLGTKLHSLADCLLPPRPGDEASLRQRLGVWSIYRNSDPEPDFQFCLRRTLSTASHETGHILRMPHCTAYLCLMNGSNHQKEKDHRPVPRLPAEAMLEPCGSSRFPTRRS